MYKVVYLPVLSVVLRTIFLDGASILMQYFGAFERV